MEIAATSTYRIRAILKIIAVYLTVTTVSSQPPKRANLITSTPFVTAKPGANVTLTCLAYRIAVDPLFNWVMWKFKGTELQDTERIKKSNKFAGDTGNITVSISNVTGDDEGVYSCYVYVDGDRGSMRDISLTVEAVPTVTSETQEYRTWTRPVSYKSSRKRPGKKSECCRLLRRLIKSQTCIPISLQTLTAEIDILQQYGKISQAGHKRLLDIIHRIWKKKKNINDNG